ncbi:MAG TPA: EamA family transporter [Candidatus Limnocylindrales bacterium]
MDQPTKPSSRRATPDRRAVALGMAILYTVWGSTYLAIAVAVETLPPFLMAAARFGLAGLLLLTWVALRDRAALRWPTRRELRDSTIVGGLLLGGGMGGVAWGEQTIPSGIAALLIGMMPVWVAIFGLTFYGERLPRIAVVGIVVGFVGVGILVGPTAFGETGALDAAGLLAILISPIAWSLGSLFATHRADLPRHPLVATGFQMLTGAVVLAIMSLIASEPGGFHATAVSVPSFLAFLYLTIIGSVVAFTTYGWMIRVAPLPLVTTYAYVNPVVAVILGAIVLHEPIEPRTILAGGVIVLAVALIVTARGRMVRPADASGVTTPPAPTARPASPAPSRSASG